MKNNELHKQAGFTIVELMVTMVIILLVAGGAYKVFSSSWTTYRVQEGLSRVQENGRFAMSFMTKDIREAGYRGCASFGPITNTLDLDGTNEDTLLYDFNVGIQGYDSTSASALGLSWLTPVSGSDVIVIRTSTDNGVGVVKNNSSSQLFTVVTLNEPNACAPTKPRISGICEGDILMVSDCSKSRIFQTGNIQVASGELNLTHPATGDPGNNPTSWGGASSPPSERFGTDAEIMKVSTFTYYVALNAANQPALYRKVGKADPQELVEGVETMQVLYGEDTDADRSVNVYRAAASVANWASVRSVRIGLLMRTLNEIPRIEPDAVAHPVLHTAVGPYNDRRLRRTFTATVGIRNRLP